MEENISRLCYGFISERLYHPRRFFPRADFSPLSSQEDWHQTANKQRHPPRLRVRTSKELVYDIVLCNNHNFTYIRDSEKRHGGHKCRRQILLMIQRRNGLQWLISCCLDMAEDLDTVVGLRACLVDISLKTSALTSGRAFCIITASLHGA